MKTLTPRQKKIQVTRQIKSEIKELEKEILESIDLLIEKNKEAKIIFEEDNNVIKYAIIKHYLNR